MPRAKSTEESTLKSLRVPNRLIERIEKIASDSPSYAKFDFSIFTNEALEEKLEKIEKRKSR
ncbi:hypothetical protein [Leptospira interrogans]|nr:hypothetical protein [Leptospira interrogans]